MGSSERRRSASPRRALALAVLALTLLGSKAHAQDFAWDQKSEQEIAKRAKAADKVERSGATWFHVATASYEVHTQIDERFTAECSLFMDVLRERLSGIMKGPSRVNRKADVFVFDSREKFKATLKSSARGWYKFAFDGEGKLTEHALYTYVEGEADRSFAKFYRPILLHEGTHQLLRELAGARATIPKWFDEGLACYFQLWDLRKTYAQNLESRSSAVINKRDFATSMKERTFPSLEGLLGIQDADWAKDDFGPKTKGQYSAAESFIMFLMADPKERKKVSSMYEAVVAGTDPALVLDAKDRKRLAEPWLQFAEKVGGARR